MGLHRGNQLGPTISCIVGIAASCDEVAFVIENLGQPVIVSSPLAHLPQFELLGVDYGIGIRISSGNACSGNCWAGIAEVACGADISLCINLRRALRLPSGRLPKPDQDWQKRPGRAQGRP